jgi:hypothetical protein
MAANLPRTRILRGVFLGHYGVAFAAKRASPETSLGTLTFAAQWLDELWPILLLLGVERVRIAPGLMAASDLGRRQLSHLTQLADRDRLLVLSHWVLDLFMHAPDLPLYPGGPRVAAG